VSNHSRAKRPSALERRELELEEIIGIDPHRRVVTVDLQAYEAVQAAPSLEGTDGRRSIGTPPDRPGRGDSASWLTDPAQRRKPRAFIAL
jgi:hypothetical protein